MGNHCIFCANADGKGCKMHIVGVAWNSKSKVLPIECIYNLIDTNGDAII